MLLQLSLLFFFNGRPPSETYTLSLHDALPISCCSYSRERRKPATSNSLPLRDILQAATTKLKALTAARSEEHTSELQSRGHLVCRLLLEKKKKIATTVESIQQGRCVLHMYSKK